MTKTNRLDRAELMQFTGTETWFRSLNPCITYTDGARYVAEAAGAYWLIDEIALAQRFQSAVRGEEFQVWTLKVNEDRSAALICEDGNGRMVYVKKIPFTDFPEPEFTLWCTGGVILLPSEY